MILDLHSEISNHWACFPICLIPFYLLMDKFCNVFSQAYASILYLKKLRNFKIILRGKLVEQFSIAGDLKHSKKVTYTPQGMGLKEVWCYSNVLNIDWRTLWCYFLPKVDFWNVSVCISNKCIVVPVFFKNLYPCSLAEKSSHN